ncbi:MAG: SWIM zinc finger family protein [Acidobacteria bacterium]|nr:SWIM zinc finger family protein [Acidobacteriota bacterium]
MAKLRGKGESVQPVEITGRAIAQTFWGRSWCMHLEKFSDYANRLPRGRTYVRNRSVCHLEIRRGEVVARVSGSELYKVKIGVRALPAASWTSIKERCTGQIASLLDLLQGRLSAGVMSVVTEPRTGLFPQPGEMDLDCSCPDWATMCKHVAAVLYGVGARLDQQPALLFLLRGVDHEELIGGEAEAAVAAATKVGRRRRLAEADLEDVFGVEIEKETPVVAPAVERETAKKSTPRRGRTAASRGRTEPVPIMPATITGGDVASLRKRLALNRTELGRLLRMSAAAVGVWEKRDGTLNLRRRAREALKSAWSLTADQARQRAQALSR